MNGLPTIIHDYLRNRLPEGWTATLHACLGYVTKAEGDKPKPTTYHECRLTDGTTVIKLQIYLGHLDQKSWVGIDNNQISVGDPNADLENFLNQALERVNNDQRNPPQPRPHHSPT